MVKGEKDPVTQPIERPSFAPREFLDQSIDSFKKLAIQGDMSRTVQLEALKQYESIISLNNFVQGVSRSIEQHDPEIGQWLQEVATGQAGNAYFAQKARRKFQLQTYDTTDRKPAWLLRGLTGQEWKNAKTFCIAVSNIHWQQPLKPKNK